MHCIYTVYLSHKDSTNSNVNQLTNRNLHTAHITKTTHA